MTTDLNDLRTAQEHLKYLDSIEDKLERTRYMAFILATETSLALEPLLGQLQEAEVTLGQLETLRPAYEVLKSTVNLNACPCEFCRARDELILGAGKLLEGQQTGQEGQGE